MHISSKLHMCRNTSYTTIKHTTLVHTSVTEMNEPTNIGRILSNMR